MCTKIGAVPLALVMLLGCANSAPVQNPGLDWESIATTIVERMDLQAGERVLLLGRSGAFDPLVPLLRAKVAAEGAEDLGAISVSGAWPSEWASEFTEGAAGKSRAELITYFSDVDVAVMLPGAAPSDRAYAAMQDVLHGERGRTIHFHWSGAYGLDGEALPIDERVNEVYQRALLQTDYAELREAQNGFETAMRGGTVRVTTSAGTDIRFEIGARPVTKQDGDASGARAAGARNLIDREIELPPGAVRVAPLEETVHGRIAFPPTIWSGARVEGLVMTFERGTLVSLEATSGRGAVEAELERAGDAGRSFREFALGMNPLLAIPSEGERWIPYYGYGAGVVRLSLGDNTELGGRVTGGYVRWNFFHDATVTIGGEVWVRDGVLLNH